MRSKFCLVLGFLISTLGIHKAKAQDDKYKIGLASYYSKKFHGRKTASGQTHSASDFCAAHPTLPFGSFVRVTNLSNNKQVVVEITDRGPSKRSKRVIDLSYAAAKSLNFIRKGITTVLVEEVPGPINYFFLDLLQPSPFQINIPSLPQITPLKVNPSIYYAKHKPRKYMR
ncbi:MAG: septal ring lytic transglycosylase RlpA family protein [Tannerellaceae bacterium]